MKQVIMVHRVQINGYNLIHLEMPLINSENNLILTWYTNCVILFGAAENQATTMAITDTKIYAPDLTLSTKDNAKLLQQLKPGLKRRINWNKYQPKVTIQRPNQCLDYLIDPSFQGINRLFVLSFEDDAHRTSYK